MKIRFLHFPGEPELGFEKYSLPYRWTKYQGIFTLDFGTVRFVLYTRKQWKWDTKWQLKGY